MTTSLYAAVLALIFLALSYNVVKSRRRFRVALGDADNHEVRRRIRAHGNFAEYTPFFLVLLGLVEVNGLPGYGIHALGLVFVTGRIAHAYSVLRAETYVQETITANPVWRIFGMVCTLNCLAILAFILVVQVLMGK